MMTSVAQPMVVVLAGGDGMRLRPLTERWLGRHVPKQYCTFAGTRSMLDHTLDRAACLCDPRRILTVVGRHHRDLLRARAPRATDGAFIEQPANLDTAPGVLLGLVHAMHQDPDSTVVLLPSDHFVYPEWRFVAKVQAAVQAAERLPDRVVLLGAAPTDIEDEYGWIVPSDDLGRQPAQRVFAVESFVEKPAPRESGPALRARRTVEHAGARGARPHPVGARARAASAPDRLLRGAADGHRQAAGERRARRGVRDDAAGQLLLGAPRARVRSDCDAVARWRHVERLGTARAHRRVPAGDRQTARVQPAAAGRRAGAAQLPLGGCQPAPLRWRKPPQADRPATVGRMRPRLTVRSRPRTDCNGVATLAPVAKPRAAFERRCIPPGRRCSSVGYAPICSLVAPCHARASPLSAPRGFHHGLLTLPRLVHDRSGHTAHGGAREVRT